MSEIKSHRDLEAWHVTMDAVLETYEATADFPPSELCGPACVIFLAFRLLT